LFWKQLIAIIGSWLTQYSIFFSNAICSNLLQKQLWKILYLSSQILRKCYSSWGSEVVAAWGLSAVAATSDPTHPQTIAVFFNQPFHKEFTPEEGRRINRRNMVFTT